MSKSYINANDLQTDSYRLASKIYESGFKPDFIVAIWRGGAQIGCCVQEFLKYLGVNSDHIAIRTSRYTGIDQVSEQIQVHNLGYLVERLQPFSKVLLVDDVFDSGRSIMAVKKELELELKDRFPKDFKVATVYYKPTRREVESIPDYYVHETDKWLVFPHELEGMTISEISQHKGEEVADLLLACQKQ
jgi:uncharacterized protein